MSVVNGLGNSNGYVEVRTEIKMELDVIEEKIREKKGVTYQILIALCVNSSVLGPSMAFGYSAVALGPLMSSTSDVRIDKVQANWIATVTALAIPFGCILSGCVMKRGRKLSLLTASILSLIGWLVIYFSGTYEQIIIGRIISGIATGTASVPATVYSAEVAAPSWRATMVTWTSVAIAIGILIVYVFGYIFKDDWRMVALMCALFPLVSGMVTLAVVPETPIWLRDRGRLDEALQALKRFRGVPKDAQPSPSMLLELQPQRQRKKQHLMKHLLKRNAVMPFIIMLSYFFFQQFSGIFVVVYYAVNIIQSAGISIDPYLGAVLIGLTRLLSSVLVACASKRFGRRILSIVSGAAMTLCMAILSIYLAIEDRGHPIKDGGWIPVTCVLVYIFTSTLGFLSVPFAMTGEIYPAKVKEILSGLTTCIAYIFSSITVKVYPDMQSAIGRDGVFIFFTAMSLAGTLFVMFFLPETNGKTLREIEDMFARKKGSADSREGQKEVDLKNLPA